MAQIRQPLLQLKAELNVAELSAALKITPDEVIREFRDGRVISHFAEIWGNRIFGYAKHLNSNYRGSDASIDLGNMGPFEISVRSLTEAGIRFQRSVNTGGGRKPASQEDVIDAINAVDRVVVVDIREFPLVSFMALNSKWLLKKAYEKAITPNGLKAKRFYNLVNDDFVLTEKPFDLALVLD